MRFWKHCEPSCAIAAFSMAAILALTTGCSDDAAPPASSAGASTASSAPPPPPPPPSSASTSPAQQAAATPSPSGQIALPEKLPQMLPDGTAEIPVWATDEKDEPFKVRKFLEARSAPADNAAPLYFAALAAVGPNVDFVYPPDQWQEMLPQVKAIDEEIGNLADPDRLKAGAIPLASVEQAMQKTQPALGLLDTAQLKKQCVFVTGLRMDSNFFHAMSSRAFARICLLQLYHAGVEGDFAEAEKSVARTLRLSRDLRPRGTMICQLVSVAVDGMVMESIADFTLPQNGLTAENCDRLLSLLDEHQRESVPCVVEGMRMEYVIFRNGMEDMKQGNGPAQGIVALPPGALAKMDWPKEEAAAKKAFTVATSILKKPIYEISLDQFEKQEISKLRADGAVLVPTMMTPVGPMLKVQARHRAMIAGTQCLLAVKRYQLSHGKLPENLADATKDASMKDMPLDPYDGQPMKYAVLDGQPVVYSIGLDKKDDGGRVDWGWDTQKPGDYIFRIGTPPK
jgi:hypothetical protein